MSDDPAARPIPRGLRRGAELLLLAGTLALAAFQLLHLLPTEGRTRPDGDALQWVAPALDWSPLEVAADDIPLGYNRGLLPTGYRALIFGSSRVLGRPRALALLAVGLYLAALLALWWAARSLAGPLAGLLSPLLLLTTRPHVLCDLALVVPRSFGTPILALAVAALIRGSVFGLALTTLLGALFYPVAGFASGLALTLLVLVLPDRFRGSARGWSLPRRSSLVAVTALLSALAMLPAYRTVERWGPTLRSDAVVEFPELGPKGRLWADNRVPFDSTRERVAIEAGDLLLERRGDGALLELGRRQRARLARWLPLLLVPLLGAALVLAWRDERAARFLCLPAAALLAFWLSKAMPPLLYLPPRHLTYVAPVVVSLLWAALPVSCVRHWGGTRLAAWGALPLAAWLILFGVELPQSTKNVLHPLSSDDVALHLFAASTPPASRFAAFPDGIIDQIPFYARRRVLMSLESHNPYHRRFVLEMRRRFTPLAAALFGPRREALDRLRDEFGVRYLILDDRDFARPPSYFEPFSKELAKIWSDGDRQGFASLAAAPAATVFRSGRLAVLDLALLSSPHPDAPAPAGTGREPAPDRPPA